MKHKSYPHHTQRHLLSTTYMSSVATVWYMMIYYRRSRHIRMTNDELLIKEIDTFPGIRVFNCIILGAQIARASKRLIRLLIFLQ